MIITTAAQGIWIPHETLIDSVFKFEVVDEDFTVTGGQPSVTSTFLGLDAALRFDGLGNSKGGTIQAIDGLDLTELGNMVMVSLVLPDATEQRLWAGIFRQRVLSGRKMRLEFLRLNAMYMQDAFYKAGYPKVDGLTMAQHMHGTPSLTDTDIGKFGTVDAYYGNKWNNKPNHAVGISALDWSFNHGVASGVTPANVVQFDLNDYATYPSFNVRSRGHDFYDVVTRWGYDGGKQWSSLHQTRAVGRFKPRRFKAVSLNPSRLEKLNTTIPSEPQQTYWWPDSGDFINHVSALHTIDLQTYLKNAADIENNPNTGVISDYKPKDLIYEFEIRFPKMVFDEDGDNTPPDQGVAVNWWASIVSTLGASGNTMSTGTTLDEFDSGTDNNKENLYWHPRVLDPLPANSVHIAGDRYIHYPNWAATTKMFKFHIPRELLTDYAALNGGRYLKVHLDVSSVRYNNGGVPDTRANLGHINMHYVTKAPVMVEERIPATMPRPVESYKPFVGGESYEGETNGLLIGPALVKNLPNGQDEYVTSSEIIINHGTNSRRPTVRTRFVTTSTKY